MTGPPPRILLNRGSGSAGNRSAVERALRSADVDGRPQWLDGERIAKAASQAVDEDAGLIVAGGGDGTVSAIAGVLAGTEVPLAILPLGTLNHFARELGLPTDIAGAARVIAEGRIRRVDVGEVNGRVFVNNSAIGLYPLMVDDRESQQRRLGRRKRLAMAVAAARTLARFASRRLSLTIDDRTARVETPLLFVGNNSYRLELPGAGTRNRLDGGELSVILLRRQTRWGLCIAAVRALAGRDSRSDLVRFDGVQRLRVDSNRPFVAVSVDGETERMAPPLDYRIRPKALLVVAPR